MCVPRLGGLDDAGADVDQAIAEHAGVHLVVEAHPHQLVGDVVQDIGQYAAPLAPGNGREVALEQRIELRIHVAGAVQARIVRLREWCLGEAQPSQSSDGVRLANYLEARIGGTEGAVRDPLRRDDERLDLHPQALPVIGEGV